jgi:hypothetical protein
VKQIEKKKMHAGGMVVRVRKEVEIHSQLKHPSILEVCILALILFKYLFFTHMSWQEKN